MVTCLSLGSNRKEKKVFNSRLHRAFKAFATGTSVTLPVGLQDAIMTEDFDLGKCLTTFGLDWVKAKAKIYSMKRPPTRREREAERATKVFKYNGKFYQDVNNFCDNYDGLKNHTSAARKDVVNTDFPKSTCLVIPGSSNNNYRWLPAEWKDGTQDLSTLKDVAYLLEKKEKPTGSRLLLVACKDLKRAAASALLSHPQRRKSAKSHHVRKRPASAP